MIAAQRRSRLSLTAESSPDTIGRARWTAALLAGVGQPGPALFRMEGAG